MPSNTDPDKTANQQGGEPTPPADAQGGKGGKPDWERAASDYKAQRDAARSQLADVQKQVEEMKASMEGLKSAEDVQKAVDDALAKAAAEHEAAQANWAEQEKSLVIAAALAEGGCIDTGALLSHIDTAQISVKDGKAEGIDVKALQGSYPYLFGKRQQAGSTGADPAGAAPNIDERLDKAFGV